MANMFVERWMVHCPGCLLPDKLYCYVAKRSRTPEPVRQPASQSPYHQNPYHCCHKLCAVLLFSLALLVHHVVVLGLRICVPAWHANVCGWERRDDGALEAAKVQRFLTLRQKRGDGPGHAEFIAGTHNRKHTTRKANRTTTTTAMTDLHHPSQQLVIPWTWNYTWKLNSFGIHATMTGKDGKDKPGYFSGHLSF